MSRWTRPVVSSRGSGQPLAVKACATESTASRALFPAICMLEELKVPVQHACMKAQRRRRRWEGR
eukprot:879601-Ditylum_brightwellii.AAC.1